MARKRDERIRQLLDGTRSKPLGYRVTVGRGKDQLIQFFTREREAKQWLRDFDKEVARRAASR